MNPKTGIFFPCNLSLSTSGGSCELLPFVLCIPCRSPAEVVSAVLIPSRSISPLTTGASPKLREGNWVSRRCLWSPHQASCCCGLVSTRSRSGSSGGAGQHPSGWVRAVPLPPLCPSPSQLPQPRAARHRCRFPQPAVNRVVEAKGFPSPFLPQTKFV